MAEGTITGTSRTKTLLVLENRNATTSAPTAATDGVSIVEFQRGGVADMDSTVAVYVTGTGTVTAQIRVWLYFSTPGQWFPAGIGTDADKGKLNDGTTLGETSSDVIAHSQPLYGVGMADRVYFQITVAGSVTRLDAWLISPKNTGVL